MKIVVFAGGVGTRLWPLSRKHTPKQFEKIIGDKSTLQQTIDRLLPQFKPHDICIATGIRYKKIVLEQLPEIPSENFIFEPEMRDVGPAIGMAAMILEKRFENEPMAILWCDHLVKNISAFRDSLSLAENKIKNNEANFVFIAQKPRFANQNIGWIELGDQESISESGNINNSEEDVKIYHFKKLRYRPKLSDAQSFFENKNFVWNLGYFVTKPKFLTALFKTFVPDMYEKLLLIKNSWGTADFEKKLAEVFPTLEKISFDDAILEKLRGDGIYVISADLGWSDVGAWEALKEALSNTENDNVTKGNVMLEECADGLFFNYSNQLLVGIDLEKMLVINTNDVLLICPKTSVPKIKKLVENLAGTPNEHLT
ncbi:MAG: sugar phosphate nucleotidyltransferase [Candidatus Levybacteria bacterium]|nr:sugar phosphate nucleotidyltransferase [Candidatus Levybacteria bacterium]